MKILCLHGSYGSAAVRPPTRCLIDLTWLTTLQNFQVQLGPLIDEIKNQNPAAQFKWIDGGNKVAAPLGFEDYFGVPPLYRFVDYDGVNELDNIVTKIRSMPAGISPEDTIRRLSGGNDVYTAKAVRKAMDRLFKVLDDDPEIEV